jgi:hypothetical protein
MADNSRSEEMRNTAVDAVVGGVSGLLALATHGALAVPAAAAAPEISAGIKGVLSRITQRRDDRRAILLTWAAQYANLTPEELQHRCESDPQLEELLLFALHAVDQTAMREKILALSLALASGITSATDEKRWQMAFARAMTDLGREHLVLLDRFTRTANQVGLGNGDPDFDKVPDSLSESQVRIVGQDLPVLPQLLATLQTHGLIQMGVTGGGTYGGGGSVPTWSITDFGREVHELVTTLGELLRRTST